MISGQHTNPKAFENGVYAYYTDALVLLPPCISALADNSGFIEVSTHPLTTQSFVGKLCTVLTDWCVLWCTAQDFQQTLYFATSMCVCVHVCVCTCVCACFVVLRDAWSSETSVSHEGIFVRICEFRHASVVRK